MNPLKYYLCRSDKNTKQRHVEVAHTSHSGIDVVKFVSIDHYNAKEPLRLYNNACQKKDSTNPNTIPAQIKLPTGSSRSECTQELPFTNSETPNQPNLLSEPCSNPEGQVKLTVIEEK